MKYNLTKSEALEKMIEGSKISREYFGSEEYIYMDKDRIIRSEEGYDFIDWWYNIEPTIPSTSETPWGVCKDSPC